MHTRRQAHTYASQYMYVPVCMHPCVPTLIHTLFTCCSHVVHMSQLSTMCPDLCPHFLTFIHASQPSLTHPSHHRCFTTIIHASHLSSMCPGHICIFSGLNPYPHPHTALIHMSHVLALS